MGYATVGITGAVTSWSGTANTTLINAIGAHTASLSVSGNSADRTAFAGSLTSVGMGPGLRSWTGSISARFPTTAVNGIAGALAVSGGYALHIRSWALTIAAKALDITAFGATATTNGWRSFRPGLLSISARASAFVDSGTGIALPPTTSASAAAATFTLDGTRSFTGNVLYSASSPSIKVDDLNTVDFDMVFDGAVTAVGASNIFAAGAVGLPDWDASGSDGIPDTTLTLTADTGRTYAGPAFWNSIAISVDPAAYTTIEIGVQGAGALTAA